MSVKIDLAPEIEKSYAARAAAQGGPLQDYLQRVLEEQAIPIPPAKKLLTPAERAAYWRVSAGGLPHTALLSDEAIGRESIYSVRG